MNNDNTHMVLIVCGIIIFIGLIAMQINNDHTKDNLEKLQKQAIIYNYATYDENGEFVWIIPDEKKE